MMVGYLQIPVVEESLIILHTAAAHMVIGHRECRVVGIAHPEDRTVFTVVGDAPETGLGCNQRLVAIVIVCEGLGRLGDIDLIGLGRDEVVGFVAVRDGLGERRVGFEIGEAARRRVIEEVAAEVVGTESEGRVLVDCDHRIRIGFAANRRVAGCGTRGVLVEIVRRVGRCLCLTLLVIGSRTATVADGVVVEVLGEAGNRLAILRTAG